MSTTRIPGFSSFALSLPTRLRYDSCGAKLLRTLTAAAAD